MYNWVSEIKRGRTSTRDEPRSERPVEAATPEIIEKVQDIILNDKKTPQFGKKENALSSRQYTYVHLCCCNGAIARIEVEVVATPTIFTGFNAQ